MGLTTILWSGELACVGVRGGGWDSGLFMSYVDGSVDWLFRCVRGRGIVFIYKIEWEGRME